jgi:hypothetical protein
VATMVEVSGAEEVGGGAEESSGAHADSAEPRNQRWLAYGAHVGAGLGRTIGARPVAEHKLVGGPAWFSLVRALSHQFWPRNA